MNELQSLILNDFLAFRGWFKHQTISKLAVVLLFFTVFGLVSTAIYFFSYLFFHNLTAYGVYGILTAAYIIHASLVVLGYWAVIGSLSSTATFLLTPNKKIDYISTLPVRSSTITHWLFIKTLIVNSGIFIIGLLPVTLAYGQAFNGVINPGFLLRVMLTIFALVTICSSCGNSIAYMLAHQLRRSRRVLMTGGIVIFLASTFLLLRIIFPRTLAALYYADSTQFNEIYHAMPLSNPFLPTGWLTLSIVSDTYLSFIYLAPIVFLVLYINHRIEKGKFIEVMQYIRSYPFISTNQSKLSISNKSAAVFVNTQYPLVYKDWLSLFRTPSETGYITFLCSIVLFFFALILYASRARTPTGQWQNESIIFTFAWLLFFITAFLLRLVFPLMAREKKTSWYIFSLPVERIEVLHSKMIVGLSIGLILSLGAITIVIVMPFGQYMRSVMGVAGTFLILLLAFFHSMLGSISPNFESGNEPEKVSTSALGIVTLGLSLCATVIGLFWLYGIIYNKPSILYIALLLFASLIICAGLIYSQGRRSVKSYWF